MVETKKGHPKVPVTTHRSRGSCIPYYYSVACTKRGGSDVGAIYERAVPIAIELIDGEAARSRANSSLMRTLLCGRGTTR